LDYFMKNSISKPVLAILAISIILIIVALRFGPRPPTKPQPESVAETKTETVAPTAAAPAPVAEQNAGELPPVVPISLTNVVIEAENGTWLRDRDYLEAPHQPQEFGGVTFLMDGMIQLQGKMSKEWKNRSYRSTVIVPLALTNFSESGIEIVQRGSNVASLHLLGATRYGSNQQKEFADIIWRYTDGTAVRTPIEYLTHFRDWVRNPYEEPDHLPYAFSKVVWAAPQPSQPSHVLRLYRTSFANPAPDKTIRQIELVSAMEDPTLFVVGLTLDPLRPGQRPDPSADLEPTDLVPPKRIEILVQSADGQPLPQSKLQIQFDQQANQKSVRTSGFLTTDANGSAHVNYPPQDLDQLSISASHEDCGGRRMLWDLKAGDTVPESYIIKLGSSVNIGGIVVDETGSPVAEAKISLYRFWSGGDEMNKKGEQADFTSRTVTTDAQGIWQANGLPTELLDHIGADVRHPDYITANFNVGQNGATESQLRAGTLKTVLHRGLDVRGLVTDDNYNPISGATVWAGLRYYRDRQQTKTDREGKFRFHNIADGEVDFSVSAKGRQPDSRKISVTTDMAEIVFKLSGGKTIRAVVQDENSLPIPGVRVVLEGNGDIGRTYEFSTSTDKDGRFTWDAAPSEPMQFYFGKEGYESKREVKLVPDEDNVVTLHHPRQLQGLVLDADTAQPVTKFSVRTGTASGDDSNVYGVIQYKEFSAADGKFTMSLTEEADNAVAVYADGYADKIEKFPEAQSGTVQVTVHLKPAATLSGVVLAPDGTPAPGVTVAAAAEGTHNYVQLTGGRLRSYDSHNKITTTDAEGRFKISSPPDDGLIVAAGEPGFAMAPLAEVRSSSTIRLQAWGRIEGTLKIGGQPGVGKDLLFNLAIPGIGTDFNGYKSTTDDQGKFTMEKIPPGEGTIVRLIQNSPNSWTHSDNTSVTVKPGETTQVSLGDNGAVLVGKVVFENPPTNRESLSFEGNLSGQMPQPQSFNSPEEAQAFYNSPEWKALMKQNKNYSIEMKPDGAFTVDDVAPGVYSLNISARLNSQRPWEHPPVGQGSMQITVPDSFSPSSPINLGEIMLQPVQQQ
jgi:hypothetical protein